MAWMVTGGAGYIGSHVTRALADAGLQPVVFDDLSSGFEQFVDPGVPFIRDTLLNQDALDAAVADHDIEGVIHVAGFKYAGVSVERPVHTYDQNVTGTLNLLRAMQRADVDKVVFSSSAAVYGTPDVDLVTETTALSPESPYGRSKLFGEWALEDAGRAYGLKHASLRYFNVVGSGYSDRYDTSPHNLFPKVFDMLVKGSTPKINGDDYATPDGTCVRDYLHVADLALAHVAAARRLSAGEPIERVYNLGSGDGVSVRQIMDSIREVTEIPFDPEIGPRRAGDPARIVANGDLAARDLDWQMRHTLSDMVSSAWEARQQAGDAYPA